MEIIDITPEIARSLLPPRPESTAKWDYGRLLVIGGQDAMPGAALLCASAAARSGVGLVRLAAVKDVCLTVAAHMAECTYAFLPTGPGGGPSADALPLVLQEQTPCAAAVLGPGLGRSAGAEALVHGFLSNCTRPLVVDADGLFFTTREMLKSLAGRGVPTILTPHVVEFSRLCGHSVARIEKRPALYAALFARENGVILVLKGPTTFVAAPGDGPVWRHSRPNSGLAKGGSGDVLAGLMGGLLAQSATLEGDHAALRAALCAVWLHGRAGQLARGAWGPRAMTPGGVIDRIPAAFLSLEPEN